MDADDLTFIPEQIEPTVMKVIEEVLKDKPYEEHLLPRYVDELCERTVAELVGLHKPFKFMGTFYRGVVRLSLLLGSAGSTLT